MSSNRHIRVLLYGSTGWIGGQIDQYLREHPLRFDVVHGKARLHDYESVRDEIARHRPERIVCCAGLTHNRHADAKEASQTNHSTIDYLEQPSQLRANLESNLTGVLLLASSGVHTTYIGTGCIFEYDESHPKPRQLVGTAVDEDDWPTFQEHDNPNFFGSAYSVVKGQTDTLLRSEVAGASVLNLRIRMPVSLEAHPRDFITKIAGYPKVIDVPNAITVLPTLLPWMAQAVHRQLVGTFHMVNPGWTSHSAILDEYRRTIDPAHTYELMSLQEQDTMLKARRSNNVMSTKVTRAQCFMWGLPRIPDAMDAVKIVLQHRAAQRERSGLDETHSDE